MTLKLSFKWGVISVVTRANFGFPENLNAQYCRLSIEKLAHCRTANQLWRRAHWPSLRTYISGAVVLTDQVPSGSSATLPLADYGRVTHHSAGTRVRILWVREVVVRSGITKPATPPHLRLQPIYWSMVMTSGQCRRRSQSASIVEALPCEGLWYDGTIPPIRTDSTGFGADRL
jgi:hypothetical protein